jgi:hypothetical protein
MTWLHLVQALMAWLSAPDATGGLEDALQRTPVDSPAFNELADAVIANIKVCCTSGVLLHIRMRVMICVLPG